MSDLLNSASLVMIPSGYKEDVVYSQIPTDGAGDLSFTRASNGTRVNSAGLVEVTPWNLLQQSQSFTTSGGAWNYTAGSGVTTGQTGYDGTTNAVLFTDSGANPVYGAYQSFSQLGSVTLSIYAKAGSTNIFNIDMFQTPTATVRVNLSTGAITSGSGVVESVGNGWYRISVTAVMTDSYYVRFGCPSTGTVYLQNIQANIGSTAKPYFPTTDRLNVPRLTYQNGGGGCPSLLLEKQSTNLQYYSQQFDLWSNASDLTVSANATTSPDGTQNADKLNENSSNGYHIIGDSNFNSTAGTTYTMSFFAKASERSYARILAPASSYNTDYAYFDLTNGSVSVSSGTASMQSMGNGWYRCVWSLAAVSTSGGIGMWIGPARNMTDAYNTYTGTSGSGIFVYGAQLEASSYATSYIPTTSASATRVADVMTVNLPNTNMTFTAYLECEEAPIGTAAGDWFSIYSNVSLLGRAYGYANTFGFADAYNLGVASGTKMVWKQESGSTGKLFKGGALVGTTTTGTYTDPFNRLLINGAYLDKPVKIKEFVFFDNALTDAECIQLTA